MKTIYALMKGENIIKKSEKHNDLIQDRDNNPGSYICIWIGRIKLSELENIPAEVIEDQPEDDTPEIKPEYSQPFKPEIINDQELNLFN